MKLVKLKILNLVLWVITIIAYLGCFVFDGWLLFLKIDGKFSIPYLFDLFTGTADIILGVFGIDPKNLNLFTGIIMLIASAFTMFLLVVTILIILRLPFAIWEYFYIKGQVFIRNALANAYYEYEEAHNLPHENHETGDEWLIKRKEKERLEEENKKRQKEAQQESYSYQEQQTYNNYSEQNNYEQSQQTTQTNKTDELLIKAKAVYMLDNLDFTETYLKQMRKKLIKTFHSDNGEENEAYAQNVNLYYEVLKPYARKE